MILPNGKEKILKRGMKVEFQDIFDLVFNNIYLFTLLLYLVKINFLSGDKQ